MFTRYYQRIISMIALVAVVFASVAPAISHAIEAKNGNKTLWQEVCSAQGVKFVSVVDATSAANVNVDAKKLPSDSDSSKMGMHFEHCPYCLNHFNTATLPAISTALMLVKLNAVERIQVYAAPIVVSYHSTTHPSHAPPILSLS